MTKVDLFKVIDRECMSPNKCSEMKAIITKCPILNEEDLEIMAYEVGHTYSSEKMISAITNVVECAERRSKLVSIDDIQKLSEMKRSKSIEEIRQESLKQDGERLGGAIISLLDAILK